MNARTTIPDSAFDAPDFQVAQLRVPPHSVEAESSVLGGLLLNNAAWDRVGDILTDSDFYRHEHRLIYAAIGALVNSSRMADVVTTFAQLQSIGKAEEAGGLSYLNALAQYVPGAGNIRRYAEIVRERSVLRKLVAVGDEIAAAGFNPQGKSVADLLDECERRVANIGEESAKTAEDWEGVDTGMVRLLDRIQEHANGAAKPDYTPTGLKDLDERLDGGLRPGDLVVIGARPGMGKSALALSIGVNIAMRERKPVGIFSMEMSRAQLNNRMMAMVGRIHLSRIKRPERLRDTDWPSLTEAVELLRPADININDQSALNINQLRAKARALKRQRGKLGLIVVDYLGLMAGTDPKMPRAYQIEDITKGLKALAKELGCPILLLVQLNREVDKRTDHEPMLADLRDSGSIEQDADIVVFVHRPIKSNPDLDAEWAQYAKLFIAKLRDGEPGNIDAQYIGEHTWFRDWPTDTPVPSKKVRVAKAGL